MDDDAIPCRHAHHRLMARSGRDQPDGRDQNKVLVPILLQIPATASR